ncbi:MAG: hypothetical protein N2246_01930, partial [Candidatus Sumerlaeia bacterium]|nr:hypothetical protein [Candidatus Sumerlaeia bacterium]
MIRKVVFNIILISLTLVLKPLFIFATDNETTTTIETKIDVQKTKPMSNKLEKPFAKVILHPQR